MYPLHNCKTLHLVRHAEGIHNVAGERDHNAYRSPEYFDAHLTPLGWDQVDKLRRHVQDSKLAQRIELVITSPLLRTMQTAAGVFGGEKCTNENHGSLLMVQNGADSSRPAISSLNAPPFVAVELCRERLAINPCDRRRSITEYRGIFPAIDFSLVEDDEDVIGKIDVRENDEELAIRGRKFFDWLWTRKEVEIAIVSHSAFLRQTLSTFGKDCHSSIQQEICEPFANCELRSVVLVDKKMLGSATSKFNYLEGSRWL